MMMYTQLRNDRRKFLALTGLTLREFQLVLPAFARSSERLHLPDRTLAGRRRQRFAGGGRKAGVAPPGPEPCVLLGYLQTPPLQAVRGELFGISQPRANYWIHRLLPSLRQALDELGVLPERDPRQFARRQATAGEDPRLVIDGTERRRQRPKNPAKQAAHSS